MKTSPLQPILYFIIFALGVVYVASKKDSLVEVIKVRERVDHYSLLLIKEMGYGGLIHNFKNYLIRREASDYRKAKDNIKKLQGLNQIISQVKNPVILQNHASLFVMIQHYDESLDFIQSRQDQPVDALDQLVAFNDTGSLSILNDIEQANISTKIAYKKASDELWMAMVGFVALCFLLFLFSVRQNVKMKRVRGDLKRIHHLSQDQSERLKVVDGVVSKLVNQALPDQAVRPSENRRLSIYKLDGIGMDVAFAKLAIFILLSNMKHQIEYKIIKNELIVSGINQPDNLASALTFRLENMGIYVELIEQQSTSAQRE